MFCGTDCPDEPVNGGVWQADKSAKDKRMRYRIVLPVMFLIEHELTNVDYFPWTSNLQMLTFRG